MSKESQEWLENNIRIGYTAKRGNAWWHKSGVTADGSPNHFEGPVPINVAADLLDTARVERVPVYYAVPTSVDDATGLDDDGNPIKFIRSHADRYGILRSSTLDDHGVFKDGYTPHQFTAALLDSTAELIEESQGDLGIGSVGLLKNGAIAWVSIEVPDTVKTPEGVEFRPNLLATGSHDGSLSTTYKRVVTDVVCDNTRNAALGEAGQQFKVKHSKYSQLKLADAREALGIIVDTGEAFAAEVARLCDQTVTDDQWHKLVDQLAPLPEVEGRGKTLAVTKRHELNNLYFADPRCTPWHGNAWGALQAVNTYEHHYATTRGAGRAERNQLNTLTGKFDAFDNQTYAALNKVLATI